MREWRIKNWSLVPTPAYGATMMKYTEPSMVSIQTIYNFPGEDKVPVESLWELWRILADLLVVADEENENRNDLPY